MRTTPEERSEAHSNQVKIVYPTYRGDIQGLKQPPHQPVEDSYREQWYKLSLPGSFELRPSEAPMDDVDSDILATLPIFIISAWTPAGAAATYKQNFEKGSSLYKEIEKRGFSVTSSTTFAIDGGWLEQGVAVSGMSEVVAMELAIKYKQPAFIRWDAQYLTVIPTPESVIPASQTSWTLHKRADAVCPMRNFRRQAQCIPEGGPWVSASQLVGAIWKTHRGVALASVGCGVCQSGQTPLAGANGNAILLKDVMLASRYGGYYFAD